MGLIEEKAKELSAAITGSEAYQNYLSVKRQVEQNEELCNKINEFRIRKFQLQSTLEGEELYNAMEGFERENAEFRKNPLVNQFLAAEIRIVRIIQQAEREMIDAVELDLTYRPSEGGNE